MDPKHLKPPVGYFEQLALDLQIEEEISDSKQPPSPEAARLRSETARQMLEGAGISTGSGPARIPRWMEDYLRLRDAGWPWRVAAYIAWASSPKIMRQPATIADLAKDVLGLTGPRQIHHWRETNPAIDEVVTVLQAAPLMAHRRDVFEALAQSASNNDHRSNPDRKLFLEITGDYVPKSKMEIERNAEDLSQYSDAELDELAKRAARINHDSPAGARSAAAEEEIGN